MTKNTNDTNMNSKTRSMNIVGAVLWGLAGLILFAQQLNAQQSAGKLVTILLTYAFVVLIPAGTALALSSPGREGLHKAMVALNGLLILLALFGFAAGLYLKTGGLFNTLGLLVFLVPAWLNLKALRRSATPHVQVG